MSIPRFAIHRPVMMFMISAVVILLGAVSLTNLPVDLMPDVTYPSVSIRVGYSGVGPLEMEELVTRPIEQSVAAVAGLQQISSTSSEGSSNVRLTFAWGIDLNEAADDVRTRLDRVRGRLPEDADAPTIFKFDSTADAIMSVGVESDGRYDRVALRELAEQDLSPRLERVPGVAAVTVSGGLRRQIHVRLTKEKIVALDLPVDRIISLLRVENQNTPLGEVAEGDVRYLLRSQGQFEDLDQVRNLVVMTRAGVPVYLKDIAEVVDTTEEERSILRINGQPGVRLQVTKQSGTNTVAVAAGIRAEVERITREVPGVTLMVLNDSSKFIERSIDSVKESAYIGALIVVGIIFFFLRNWRATFIISISIPISVIGTFALLFFAGYTLNTMTFGGLALGIGMIVDAAIVVLENAFRHMEMGKDRVTAAIEGSEEVWSAILASVLTTIAVFLPLLFLTGVSSIMFRQLSVVIIFALAMSLFVALTIVPVLCSLLLTLPTPVGQRRGLLGRVYTASERGLDATDEGYRRLLRRALVHRPSVLAVGTAGVVVAMILLMAPQGSLPSFLTIGFELMSSPDEGEVSVSAELPVGTRYERSAAVALRLEEMVKELVPEASSIITSAGGGGGGFGGGGGHRGSLQIRLVPKNERNRSSEQIAQDLRRQLAGLPGVLVSARASGGNQQYTRMFRMGSGNTSRLSLEVRGQDLDQARLIAARAKEIMDDTPGLADVRIGREEGRPEFAVRVDRPKAALFGLRQSDIANSIRTAVAGSTAAQFREHGWEYPIVVRLREEDRARAVDVEDVRISAPTSGQMVQARNLVDVQLQRGPVQIERKNQQRIVYVNSEIEADLSEAIANVERRFPELNLPQGFSVGFGTEAEEQARAFRQLRTMLILAVLLVYAVMASQYESLRDPFIVMFSIPLAAIGVVGILLLTGTPFNMQGYMGAIMLAGIVVNNAILLVDYTNTLRRRDGVPLREAVALAGRTRLRPILMTTLTTALGLVPMALAIGEGAELQAPLARVVIGGLLTSTLVTLVFVPTVYTLFEEGLGSPGRLVRRGPVAGQAAAE